MGQTAEAYPSGTQLCCPVDPREMKNINQKSKKKKKISSIKGPKLGKRLKNLLSACISLPRGYPPRNNL